MDQFMSYVMGTGTERAELLRLLREKHKEYDMSIENPQTSQQVIESDVGSIKVEPESQIHPLFAQNLPEKLQSTDLHAQLENGTINLADLDEQDMRDLKSQVAEEYERLAHQFVDARIANIDEMVEKIDRAIASTKDEFAATKQQLDSTTADNFGDQRGVQVPALDLDLFYPYFATSYTEKKRILDEIRAFAAHKLATINKETDINKEIVHSQYHAALLENRDALQQQIRTNLDELNSKFFPNDPDQPSSTENELRSRKKPPSSLVNLAEIAHFYGDDNQ
ncbi:hypothetical protein OGAPHI_002389 [Ogataea philodendri]|uniref:Uncharacterized protein n=1 Tax=Ogataea philodendri TaxID=1378263 RepID=A0A9P8PBR0_9ASCO|nr:uncharacterized protein OGAPHI_002389 [Ogataea philodendri]KAH3668635.1 hypothetical protein OGAPHI_002389 [Ogataea philodendri]